MDNKRIAAVAVVAIVLCMSLAYVVYDDEPSQTRSWNYSNLAGNLPSEVPDATDDFYLNTNYEWLSEHQETAASDTLFISMTTQALTDLYSLVVTDPNDPNVSVYSAFLVSYMDTSGRDSAGTGDLMPYITGLMEADSLSDLTDYLISGDCVLTGPFVDVSVAGFDTISDENIPVVSYDPLTLSSPSLYLGDSFRYYMDPAEDHYAKLLMLIGYSQEEADAMNDAATSLEVKLASGITMSGIADVESIYVPYTTEELDAVCSSFPILEVLEAMGYPSDTYSVFDMGWLTTLDSLYTEENFEGLRAMILRNTLDHASGFMGGEFLAEYMDYNATTLEGSWNTFISTDRAILELLNTMYCDHAANPEAEATVVSLFEQLKDAYAERISALDRMSESTKQYALDKLDAMTVLVGGPDTLDFSGLTLPSTSGGSLLDDYVAMKQYYVDGKSALIGQPIDSPYWPMQGYTINATHIYSLNRVYVSWGYLQDGYIYSSDASDESLIGRLATVIGHEITHGFDMNGSLYGTDGTSENWWTAEDRAAFESRASAVSDYISSITLLPDRTMDPSTVINEVVADMGGMALALDIASDIEGFDYVEMFTEYADSWVGTLTQQYDDMYMKPDVHPPNCIRVNMTVQQFQQFFDTFGVAEGDGMWLAPDDRVDIW